MPGGRFAPPSQKPWKNPQTTSGSGDYAKVAGRKAGAARRAQAKSTAAAQAATIKALWGPPKTKPQSPMEQAAKGIGAGLNALRKR